MENATKALLIAASVLIAILLIAFGMKIFSSTSGTSEAAQETMKATEVASFNNKFTQYVGMNKSKAQVTSLLNAVIANNATTTHKVLVNGGDAKDMINNLTEKKYNISIPTQGGYTNGYVSNINIE